MTILLGFIDERVSLNTQQLVNYSTNKIGGIPHFKSNDSIVAKCKICNSECPLICQLYCPVDEANERIIYVFCCTKSSCFKSSDGWLVLRIMFTSTTSSSHKKDENKKEFDDWGSNGADDWEVDQPGDWGAESLQTSQQIETPPHSVEKSMAEMLASLENLSVVEGNRDFPFMFDEYFVSVIEEYSSEEPWNSPESHEEADCHKESCIESAAQEGYESSSAIYGDKTFYKFMKVISKNPQQVIRYEYNGKAVPMTTVNPAHIPRCEKCGASRCFEFQLMPALMQQLTVGGDVRGVEVGTVIIYCCINSCWHGQAAKEYVLVQHDPDETLLTAKLDEINRFRLST